MKRFWNLEVVVVVVVVVALGVWEEIVVVMVVWGRMWCSKKLGFPSVFRLIEQGGGIIKMGKEDLKVSCVKEVIGKEEVWLE